MLSVTQTADAERSNIIIQIVSGQIRVRIKRAHEVAIERKVAICCKTVSECV